MRIPRVVYFFILLFLLQSTAPAQLFVGPKLELMRLKIARLKDGTLLVPPILPDSFEVEELKSKGKPEKIQEYNQRIADANKFLKRYFQEEYDFSKYRLVMDEPSLQSYDDYKAYFSTFDPDSFYVLQFGHIVQFMETPKRKIKLYDRDFLGIYETDCRTRLYLNVGKIKLFDRESYVLTIIRHLNESLHKYYNQEMKRMEKIQMKALKRQEAMDRRREIQEQKERKKARKKSKK